jgi:Spy/CpxP family protein refolding chaperone
MKRTLMLSISLMLTTSAFAHLTDAQKSQIAALRDSRRAAIEPLRARLRANRAEIREAVAAGNSAKAGELLVASHELRRQIRTARQSFRTSFEALLTPEQKTKWLRVRQQSRCYPRRGWRNAR